MATVRTTVIAKTDMVGLVLFAPGGNSRPRLSCHWAKPCLTRHRADVLSIYGGDGFRHLEFCELVMMLDISQAQLMPESLGHCAQDI